MSDATPQPPSASSTAAPGLERQRVTAVARRRDQAPRLSSIAIRTATATPARSAADDRSKGHG